MNSKAYQSEYRVVVQGLKAKNIYGERSVVTFNGRELSAGAYTDWRPSVRLHGRGDINVSLNGRMFIIHARNVNTMRVDMVDYREEKVEEPNPNWSIGWVITSEGLGAYVPEIVVFEDCDILRLEISNGDSIYVWKDGVTLREAQYVDSSDKLLTDAQIVASQIAYSDSPSVMLTRGVTDLVKLMSVSDTIIEDQLAGYFLSITELDPEDELVNELLFFQLLKHMNAAVKDMDNIITVQVDDELTYSLHGVELTVARAETLLAQRDIIIAIKAQHVSDELAGFDVAKHWGTLQRMGEVNVLERVHDGHSPDTFPGVSSVETSNGLRTRDVEILFSTPIYLLPGEDVVYTQGCKVINALLQSADERYIFFPCMMRESDFVECTERPPMRSLSETIQNQLIHTKCKSESLFYLVGLQEPGDDTYSKRLNSAILSAHCSGQLDAGAVEIVAIESHYPVSLKADQHLLNSFAIGNAPLQMQLPTFVAGPSDGISRCLSELDVIMRGFRENVLLCNTMAFLMGTEWPIIGVVCSAGIVYMPYKNGLRWQSCGKLTAQQTVISITRGVRYYPNDFFTKQWSDTYKGWRTDDQPPNETNVASSPVRSRMVDPAIRNTSLTLPSTGRAPPSSMRTAALSSRTHIGTVPTAVAIEQPSASNPAVSMSTLYDMIRNVPEAQPDIGHAARVRGRPTNRNQSGSSGRGQNNRRGSTRIIGGTSQEATSSSNQRSQTPGRLIIGATPRTIMNNERLSYRVKGPETLTSNKTVHMEGGIVIMHGLGESVGFNLLTGTCQQLFMKRMLCDSLRKSGPRLHDDFLDCFEHNPEAIHILRRGSDILLPYPKWALHSMDQTLDLDDMYPEGVPDAVRDWIQSVTGQPRGGR